MSKQEVINIIDQLSNEQLEKVANYIKVLFSQTKREHEKKLDEEQQELLDLLNYTIDSGRGDFSEKHNHYLYGLPK
jgi:hypothetical protein